MYLSIIILPLLGSIVSGFFGRKIGVTGSQILSCINIITTTTLAIIGFFEIGFTNNPVSIYLFKWLDSESFNIVWNFQFDSLTVSMLIPVLIISTLVHFYSIGYMSHDPHNQRFFSYLSLFTFMMIILVTGNNYLLMFVGWEGVGVCSYLLVSFWFTRIAANQSSMSAFLTNRVGDCFLTIAMFTLLWTVGTLDYNIVFSLSPYINEYIMGIIGICLLIGAAAKSSQVGLHIWLPMAMEGPTPVSALIHAATMVTAGVYLLIRSSPALEYNTTVLLIILWLGVITTVFSSLIGAFQQDIKKIIAYSTMSQLGMMVIAIGLSSYNIAIFHLINHAFYKALLFLGAGAVIHAVSDNQDLRKYGGLIRFLPLSYTVILIASLSLVAFPFMTGFFSKDFILESAYGQYHFSSVDVYVIAVIGATFTTLYSVKVLYLTFLTSPNGPVNSYKNAHEGDVFISLPLVILAIFSIYFGFITKDIFIGIGSGFFSDNSIFIHPVHEILINTEFAVPTFFKLLPFVLTISFTGLAIIYSEFLPNYINSLKLSNLGYYVFGFFNQRFLVEFFYNKYIVNKVLNWGGQTTKVLDKGSIEWVGPYGIYRTLVWISKTINGLSNGVVTNYALYMLVAACLYLSLSIYMGVGSPNDLISDINVGFTSVFTALICITGYILGGDKISKVSEELLAAGKASTSIDFVSASSNEGKSSKIIINSSFIPKGIFLSIKEVWHRFTALIAYAKIMFVFKFPTVIMFAFILFYIVCVLPKVLIHGYELYSGFPSISEMQSMWGSRNNTSNPHLMLAEGSNTYDNSDKILPVNDVCYSTSNNNQNGESSGQANGNGDSSRQVNGNGNSSSRQLNGNRTVFPSYDQVNGNGDSSRQLNGNGESSAQMNGSNGGRRTNTINVGGNNVVVPGQGTRMSWVGGPNRLPVRPGAAADQEFFNLWVRTTDLDAEGRPWPRPQRFVTSTEGPQYATFNVYDRRTPNLFDLLPVDDSNRNGVNGSNGNGVNGSNGQSSSNTSGSSSPTSEGSPRTSVDRPRTNVDQANTSVDSTSTSVDRPNTTNQNNSNNNESNDN